MTRWARGGNANKKKPHDASTWEQLKQQFGKQTRRTDKVPSKSKHEHGQSKMKQKVNWKVKKGLPNNSKQNNQSVRRDLAENNQNESVQLLESNQPSSSRKSLVDVLLEADKEAFFREERGGGDAEKAESDDVKQRMMDSVEVIRKKEKRREERRLKRQKKKADRMVCFQCREPGHGVAECPQMLEDVEQGTGICFRCGSTEHDVSQCTAKVDKKLGEFPFAKCFICHQTGHLSKSCPDNPRGLYPEGGGCKECGSVEHRWWNCPIRKPVKGVNVSVFPLMDDQRAHASADAEPAFMKKPKVKVKKSGPKVVVF